MLVLPEDEANRQIANGFLISRQVNARNLSILEPAGGWRKVLHELRETHVPQMQKFSGRTIVLVVDFDRSASRRSQFEDALPEELRQRVFVVGVWTEPEDLRSKLAIIYEQIGKQIADGCAVDGPSVWDNPLLRHNQPEITRMRSIIHPVLFG